MSEKITVALSADTALVVFEWLSELAIEDHEEVFADKSIVVALNTLLCELEKVMTEPFSDNYKELVERARRNIVAT